jgi:hypothetical protein
MLNGEVDTGRGGGFYPGTRPGEGDVTVRGEPPLSHDRYAIWELGADHLATYRPDLEKWGQSCPPFRAFDRDFNVIPYIPPLPVTSGPEFNGDMAGDGPLGTQPLLFGGDSQETVGVRTDFVPVVVCLNPVLDDYGEVHGTSRWVRMSRDPLLSGMGYQDFGDREDEWLDYMDSQPEWYDDAWLDMYHEGREVSGMYYAHVDSLPESVLSDILYGMTTSQILVQTVAVDFDFEEEADGRVLPDNLQFPEHAAQA